MELTVAETPRMEHRGGAGPGLQSAGNGLVRSGRRSIGTPRGRVRPHAFDEGHRTQATPWNDEDLTQAPPDWDDQIPA